MHLVDKKMHWQFGGNFEPVRIICELNWKECPRALANYIWTEVVTDVIECLNSEGAIWRILAMLVVCILLAHLIYSKTRWRSENAVNRKSLNKVGYKVQDLELKVNILTYKMQYGTWPLPHQIRQPAFRKELRNLRLTLSSSNHRNAWIKQFLLSPLQNNPCISYPKFEPRSTKNYNDFFNMETGRTSSDTQQGISAIDCSASKSSKTSIDNSAAQPARKHSQRNAGSSEKVDLKERGVSTSENSVLGRRTRKAGRENDELSVRGQSQRRSRRQNRFSRTIDECKKYLKELRNSNRNLGLASSASELSDASSVRAERNKAQTILRSSREITDMLNEAEKRREKKSAKDSKRQKEKFLEEDEDTKESLENDLNAPNGVSSMKKIVSKKVLPPTLNITFHAKMFPRDPSIEELASILASSSPKREEKSTTTSRETLHQVKTRLESLQNVLKNYEARDSREKARKRSNRNEEKVKNICRSVAATLKSIREEIDRMYESRSSAVTFEVDADDAEESGGNLRNKKRSRAICFDVEDRSKAIGYEIPGRYKPCELLGRSKAIVYEDTRRCGNNETDYRSDAINYEPDKREGFDDRNISPTSLRSSNILRLCQETFAMNFQAESAEDADFCLEDLPTRSSKRYETNTKYLQTCFDTDLDRNEHDRRSPASFKDFGSYSESQSFDVSEKANETTKERISDSECCRDQEKSEEKIEYAFSTDSDVSGIYRSVPALEELQEESQLASSRKSGRCSENAEKTDRFSDEVSKYPVPMETDEDVISLSHTSSQSDASGGGEFLRKTTGILLRQDRRGKEETLARADLQKIKQLKENRKGKSASDAEDERNGLLDGGDEDCPRMKFLEIIKEENNGTEKCGNDKNLCTDKNDNRKSNLQFDKIAEQCKVNKNTKVMVDNEMFSFAQADENGERNKDETSSANDQVCSSNPCAFPSSLDNINNFEGESRSGKHNLESIPSEYFSLSNLALRENFSRVKNINELVLQSAKSIKDCTEIFSLNQNQAIHDTRKAIQHQNETKDEATGDPENERANEEFRMMGNCKDDENRAAFGNFESFAESSRDSRERVVGNLTLKRHRGMFSITEEIFPKTSREEALKVEGKFGTWEYEQKGVKRKRTDFDDIDVIHRSLRINDSNQGFSCSNFPTVQDHLSANTEEMKFHESKELNSFDTSWKNIFCTGASDSSITDNRKITGEFNESKENFMGKNTKQDGDKKNASNENEVLCKENEAQDEMNKEKVFANCNSRFLEEMSNFSNNNSANTDDRETQVSREILKEDEPLWCVGENLNTIVLSSKVQNEKKNVCNSEQTQNTAIRNDKGNDFDLKNDNGIENIDREKNLTANSKIQNSDPPNNPPIINDIQLPIKYTEKEADASNFKENEKRKEKAGYPMKMKIESESLSSNVNAAGSATSGSYIDASSHDFIASSNVDLEKFLRNKRETSATNNFQCPSTSSFPRKNNFTWMSRTNLPLTPLKRQESGNCRLRARSNSNLSSATNLANRKRDSSEESNNRPSRSNINVLCQKRSRSYVTPRKTESSPRYSSTVQRVESKTKQRCEEKRGAKEEVDFATRKIDSSQQTVKEETNDDGMCKSESAVRERAEVSMESESSVSKKTFQDKETSDNKVCVNLRRSESSPRQVSSANETNGESIRLGLSKSESSSQQTCSRRNTSSSRRANDSQTQCQRKSSLDGKSKSRTPSKSHIPVLKVASKSSIPTPKGRSDSARKNEQEVRPRSPARSPLTMTTMWNESETIVGENEQESAVCAEGELRNKGNEDIATDRSAKRTQVVEECTADEVQGGAMQIKTCYAQVNENCGTDDAVQKNSFAKSTQINRNVVVETVQISKECSTESTQVSRSLLVENVDADKDHSAESTQRNKIGTVVGSEMKEEHLTKDAQTNFSASEKVGNKERGGNEKCPKKCESNEKSEPKKSSQSPNNSSNLFEQSSASMSQEKMVIYVNILTKRDNNVTRIVDPKKFMEYVKSRETKVEKPLEEDSRKVNSTAGSHGIISNEATSGGFDEHVPETDGLSKAVVRSSWPVTEQKETDVTAKPSVTETSTSISDLRPATEILKAADRFQVFGVPKELTSEEYVVLLDALNQESNVAHLQEIRNLCDRLETDAPHDQ